MDPDPLSAHWDSSRQSTSFSRKGWPRLSPSYASPADGGPSLHASWRHCESVDEPDTSTHVLSRRQMPRVSRSSPQRDRPASTFPERQPTPPTQPVLVRAYSGNAENTTAKSTMSSRRIFPLSGPKSSVPSRPAGPPPPSDKDFSIESILQAIEPDIQGTLDSIAEICGRSKLSLANEYGSHIAPLGEIRAPAGGLVPVEEASSTDERRADDGLIIFDDDPGLMEGGRDIHPFSFYRYLENLRQAASLLERNSAAVAGPSTQPNASTTAAVATDMNAPDFNVTPLLHSRDFASRPTNTVRDLLANSTSGQSDHSSASIVTPAVVSEVHLDAQAGERNAESDLSVLSVDQLSPDDRMPVGVRSLLSWLRWTTRIVGPESRPALQTAEGRLRAMLERPAEDHLSSQAV